MNLAYNEKLEKLCKHKKELNAQKAILLQEVAELKAISKPPELGLNVQEKPLKKKKESQKKTKKKITKKSRKETVEKEVEDEDDDDDFEGFQEESNEEADQAMAPTL